VHGIQRPAPPRARDAAATRGYGRKPPVDYLMNPVAGTLQIGGNWWWQVDGTLPPEAGMSSDVAMEVVWPGEGLYELRAGEIATAAGHGGACHSSPLIGTCAE